MVSGTTSLILAVIRIIVRVQDVFYGIQDFVF